MANRYNVKPFLVQKCENPTCTVMINRRPCEVKKGSKKFCSNKCAIYGRSKSRKYSTQDLKYVLEHPQVTFNELADKFKTTVAGVKAWIVSMRGKGYHIPVKMNPHYREFRSRIYAEHGIIPPKEDRRRGPTHKPPNDHMKKKPPVEFSKPKKSEPVFKTRKIDTEGMIKVVFKDKNHTTIYCTDPEHEKRVRDKYAYLEKDLLQRI